MEIKNEELLEYCANFEEEGRMFYKELADHVSEPVVKDYLQIFSEEEAKHREHFKNIMKEKGNRKYGWENVPELRKLVDINFKQGLFPELKWNLKGVDGDETFKMALEFAKIYEELTIDFYGTLINNCHDYETKLLLIDIECEEKVHHFYIQQLIRDFPNKHQIIY